MVHIEPFEVELWMDEHETDIKHNLAETCCASLSLADLSHFGISGGILSPSTKLTYGHIRGSPELRWNIGALYDEKDGTGPLPSEQVLVSAGAIAANYNVLYSLIQPGDHVICMYPTYQQLYAIPRSIGAEVSLWKLSPERDFAPDFEELKSLLRPRTRMVIINTPNNPTGIALSAAQMRELVEILQARGITILSDEVYRPLFHGLEEGKEQPPSILNCGYSKVVAIGSLSKAYALAGIRVGWIASRDRTIIEMCAGLRHYTTISVSQISDWVATFALSKTGVEALLKRNLALARTNCQILADFVDSHKACSWVRPVAGSTAFVKFEKDGDPVDDEAFCLDLIEKKSVLLVPGRRCFGSGREFHGYVRIGYCCETDVLEAGLKEMNDYLKENGM